MLVGAGLVGVAAIGRPAQAAARRPRPRMILELRTYRFASGAKQQAFLSFAAEAAVPAWNRAGIAAVGLFQPAPPADGKGFGEPTDVVVLLPHPSLASVTTLDDRLARDEAYQTAGAAILGAPKGDPAYTRCETVLLHGFPGFPGVRVPPQDAGRMFELRVYQSHNEERARNKVKMFDAGEFPIFDRAGMPGVFFGSALAGPDLPQLTYMVCHPDEAGAKGRWKAFFEDAAWKKLIADPSYKDNVSKVVGRFLKPAPGSQV